MQLIVELPPNLQQALTTAPSTHGRSASEYATQILRDALTQEKPPALRGAPIDPAALERLRHTRKEILQGRRFEDDSTELLREIREERTKQQLEW
ncbi:MAG: hypothetical protein ACR2PL_21625 [Dehalococcoidia bacterium]